MTFIKFKIYLLIFCVLTFTYFQESNCTNYFDVTESMNFSPCILKSETLFCDAYKMDLIYQSKLIKFSKLNLFKIFRVEILNFLIEEIPANFFQAIAYDLVSVKIISKVFIKTIDSQAFYGCSNLKYLEISSAENTDKMYGIIDHVFSPLLFLEELKLMNLNLQVLNANSFPFLINLKSLTIESYFLDSFSPETFQNNKNLISLTFMGTKNSTNFLQTLANWPSSSELSVKSLSINSCNVKYFPKLSKIISTNLIQLSLAKNPLEQILKEDVEYLEKLEILSLASTKIRKDSVTGLILLTNLKELKLTDVTTLTDLPLEIESMMSLESIYLDMSKFDKISISLPESIKKISATNLQKPSIITSNFLSKCKNLNVLHLMSLPSDNILFLLDNVNVFTSALTVLSLDNTSLLKDRLLEFLSYLKNLEVLHLNSANIGVLTDKVLLNLKSLKKLMLSDNYLRYETINTEGFQSVASHLTDLDLRKNSLITLPPCMFHTFNNFKGLNLLENNLICDCHMMWLHESIKNSSNIYPNLNFTCSSGPNDGKAFYKLTQNDLKNCSSNIVDSCTPIKTGIYKVPYSVVYDVADSSLVLNKIDGNRLKFMFDYFIITIKELNITVHSDLDKYDVTRKSIYVKLHSTYTNLQVCLTLSRNKIDYIYDYNCQSVTIGSMIVESKLTILAAVAAGAGTFVLILIISVVIGCRKWRRKKDDQHEYCEASSTEYSEPDDTYKNTDQYTYVSNEPYSLDPGISVEETLLPTDAVPPLPPFNIGLNSSKSLEVIVITNKSSKKQPSSKFRKRPPIASKISKARSSSNLCDSQQSPIPNHGDSISMHNLNSGVSMTLPRQYISRALPKTPSVELPDNHSGNIPPPKPRLSNANLQNLINNADHNLKYFSQYVSNTSLCTDDSINHPHSGDSGLGVSKVSNHCNQSLSDGASVFI